MCTDEEGQPVDYDYATGTYADGWTPEGDAQDVADGTVPQVPDGEVPDTAVTDQAPGPDAR